MIYCCFSKDICLRWTIRPRMIYIHNTKTVMVKAFPYLWRYDIRRKKERLINHFSVEQTVIYVMWSEKHTFPQRNPHKHTDTTNTAVCGENKTKWVLSAKTLLIVFFVLFCRKQKAVLVWTALSLSLVHKTPVSPVRIDVTGMCRDHLWH